MRHHLGLVACLVLTGSVADAAPGRHAGRHAKAGKHKSKRAAKVAPPIDHAGDEEPDEQADDDADSDRVAIRSADDEDLADDEDVIDADDEDIIDDERAEQDAPVRLRKTSQTRAKDWHVAIGPYLWASSVDADVSLGSSSVSTGVSFFDLKRHARYGAEVVAEASYGRFAIYGDLLYGVVGIDGSRTVGPIMVGLNANASTLLVDGFAGYRLAGNERELMSLELRGGVRYQRTAISGSLDVAGNDVMPTVYVDAAADALVGAHAVVRPFKRVNVSGAMDLGVVGESALTWSASADASIRITSHARFSLGWRTLTTQRANVSIVMHGPRAALQLMF